ncbi:MAG: WD40 repeat domain-containing protein [Isosphaeraceae bacterium]
MSRESNRSRMACDDEDVGPRRVGIGSTGIPLFFRRGFWLWLVALTALIGLADIGPIKEDARLRMVPGEAGLHTRSGVISADGTKIATTDFDGSVALRDARSGWAFERFPNVPGYVRSLSLSPDGRFLVCAADGSGVTIYDLNSRGEMRRVALPLDRVYLVAFSPHGRTIAAISDRDRRIVLWNVAEERVTRSLNVPCRVVSAAFSPDGHDLATGGIAADSSIILWDLETGRPRVVGKAGVIMALAISRDGSLIATASGHERSVRLWDVRSATLKRQLDGHCWGTTSCAFAPDGSTLVTAGNDGMVRLWTLSTGQQKAAHDGDAGFLCSVAIAPDGRWIAAMARDDYDLRMWEYEGSGPDLLPRVSRR